MEKSIKHSDRSEHAWMGNPPKPRTAADPYEDTDQGPGVWIPDVEWLVDDPSHVYHALRGYGGVVAVFDTADTCVGWMKIERLGHRDVLAWMEATNYIPPRRCREN